MAPPWGGLRECDAPIIAPAGVFTPSVRHHRPSLRRFDAPASTVPRFALPEVAHGLAVPRCGRRVFRPDGGPRLRPGKAAGAAMSWIYVVSGGIAAALFVYLVVALLWPEKF